MPCEWERFDARHDQQNDCERERRPRHYSKNANGSGSTRGAIIGMRGRERARPAVKFTIRMHRARSVGRVSIL